MSLWHHHSDLIVPTWLSDAIKDRSPGETQAPKTDLLDDNPLSVCCEWRLSYRGSPKLGVLESDAGGAPNTERAYQMVGESEGAGDPRE